MTINFTKSFDGSKRATRQRMRVEKTQRDMARLRALALHVRDAAHLDAILDSGGLVGDMREAVRCRILEVRPDLVPRIAVEAGAES